MKTAHGDCCETGLILSFKILVNLLNCGLNEDGALKQILKCFVFIVKVVGLH